MKTLLAATFTATVLTAGCGSVGTRTTPEADSPSAAPPPITVSCPTRTTITDPALAAAVASVPLPQGARYVSARLGMDGRRPGAPAAEVNVCDRSIRTADDLRALASAYARALKTSPLAGSVSTIYVGSYHLENGQVAASVTLVVRR
jgi:hypothetical protein